MPRLRPIVAAAPVAVLAGLLPLVGGLAQPPAAGAKFALLVGVNEYDHGDLKPLKYADNDAAELRDVLRAGGYTVALLTAAEAKATGNPALAPTKANIEAKLTALAKGLPRGGTLVVGLGRVDESTRAG